MRFLTRHRPIVNQKVSTLGPLFEDVHCLFHFTSLYEPRGVGDWGTISASTYMKTSRKQQQARTTKWYLRRPCLHRPEEGLGDYIGLQHKDKPLQKCNKHKPMTMVPQRLTAM
ncbi:unnamed protein product [Cuscuta europaea]|uniref:Uncharacterized protein n=1 Tax=Cuscuta europaea TaxID=41803 RepID=A0A9P0Z136_CUSEU|nr:unnamed protein product [Cuscuta europaea]